MTQLTTTSDGVLSITGGIEQDHVELSRNETGGIELLVNGQRFGLANIREVRFFTSGDESDRIVVGEGIDLPLVVDSLGTDANRMTKISSDLADVWAGRGDTLQAHNHEYIDLVPSRSELAAALSVGQFETEIADDQDNGEETALLDEVFACGSNTPSTSPTAVVSHSSNETHPATLDALFEWLGAENELDMAFV